MKKKKKKKRRKWWKRKWEIIKKYKKQLNKVLLELFKEENREKKLEKLDMNEFQRDILEIKFWKKEQKII